MRTYRSLILAWLVLGGVAGAAVIQVPGDVPTIQGAINMASPGDTVVVAEGVYSNIFSLRLSGKDITLTGTNPEDWDVVSRTILQLDPGYSGAVVAFSGTETSACRLMGLTITKGTYSGIKGNNTQATISRCWVRNNYGSNCGGINGVMGLIDRCRITGNSGGVSGNFEATGGLYACGGVISNCLIADNFAFGVGGLRDCGGVISNCLIINNRSSGSISGMSHCSGTIIHCTIANNSSDGSGGGLVGCSGTITNCVIWGNTARDWNSGVPIVKDVSGAAPTYSCYSNAPAADGNISADPQLSPGFSLKAGSPCIDAGTDTVVPLSALDYRGGPRVVDGNGDTTAVTDMGAIEFDPMGISLVVNPERLDFGGVGGVASFPVKTFELYNLDGYSWNWQFDTAGAAWLTVEPAGGSVSQTAQTITVRVNPAGLAEGEYRCDMGAVVDGATKLVVPIVLHVGKVIRVPQDVGQIQAAIMQAVDWDAIVVSPGEYKENLDFLGKKIVLRSVDPRNWNTVKTTIIDGQSLRPCITFDKGEGPDSIVEGLTVQFGAGITVASHGQGYGLVGGGILCQDSSPTIRKCQICWNGRVKSPDSWPPYGASVTQRGGGIALIGDCQARIEDCLLFGNSAYLRGAAVYANTIAGREPLARSIVERCTITQNTAYSNSFPNPTNHIVDGSTTQLQIRNVIAGYDSIQVINMDQIQYCCVDYTYLYNGINSSIPKEIAGKNGNIAITPRFVSPFDFKNPTAYDYRLEADSQCINYGDPGFDGEGLLDLAGQKRVQNGRLDMGAFEFVPEIRVVDPMEGDVWTAGSQQTIAWEQPNLDRVVVSNANFDLSWIDNITWMTTKDVDVAGWTIGPNSGVVMFPEKFDSVPNLASPRTAFDKGSGIYQLLEDTYRANRRYTLKLFVGNRKDSAMVTNWQAALTAGDRSTVVAAVTQAEFGIPEQGKWIAISLVLETGTEGIDASVGKGIGILLTGAPLVDFDEVSLDAAEFAPTARVDVELSMDNGQNWQTIAEDLLDTGSTPWTIPSDLASEHCRIRAVSSRADFVAIPSGSFTIRAWCAEDLAGDIVWDCRVDQEDLLALAAAWLSGGCVEPGWCGGADLTRDGRVGMEDLAVMAENWMK